MNQIFKVVLGWGLCIFVASNAGAGPSTGGGGSAFVCRSPAGEIQKTVFLDLWEAQQVYGWPVLKNNQQTARAQIRSALLKLKTIDPVLARETANIVERIQDTAVFLGANVDFAIPEDAKAKYFDPNCQLSGMLYFDDQFNKLFISNPIFEKLESQTEVAAAWIHEAIYKILRSKLAQTTSMSTRVLVGCLFSTSSSCLKENNLSLIFSGYKDLKFCKSKDIDFYVGKNPSDVDQLALVRAGSHDFSENLVLLNTFQEIGDNISLSQLGISSWNLRWVTSTGGYFPMPTGLFIQNRISDESFSASEFNCSSVN